MNESSRIALSPAPGPAPRGARVRAQTLYEFGLLMRNGEQVLLTLVIPIMLVAGLSRTEVVDLGSVAAAYARIQTVVPGVLAVAVLSSAFTAQAISVGFDRRYGVLLFLGTTPLGRAGLVAGKTLAIALVVVGQVLLISGVGVLLGWQPQGVWPLALLLVMLGVAAFSGLALLMAGTLRAEATLAGANLVFVVLLFAGGMIIPADDWPSGAASLVQLLPTAALAEGLRDVLRGGVMPGISVWVVLVAWAVAAPLAAGRFFRWS